MAIPRIAVGEYTLSEFAALSKSNPSDSQNCANWRDIYSKDPQDNGITSKCGGIKTWAQARDLFDHGWAAGSSKLNALRSELGEVTCAKSTKRRACYGPDGDDLRVDRALAGDWDRAWRTSRREVSPGLRTIDLHVSYGGNWGCTPDELFWSGATAAVLTDLLGEAGYSVALTAACPICVRGGPYWIAKILLKEAHEPMQIDALAALLCHAGVFRTMGFRALADAPFPIGSNLGYPTTWASVREALESIGHWPEDAVIVESAFTRDGAIREINRVLNLIQGKEN